MPTCPQCGSPAQQPLGSLGIVPYWRCQSCGWTYNSSTEEPVPEDQENHP